MANTKRYPKEFKERAVRLVFEQEKEYPSQWGAILSVSGKMGCTPETLRRWVRQFEVDQGNRDGLSTEERVELKRLKKENKELKRANEILRLASAYFAKAELDRQ
jgi:transposase